MKSYVLVLMSILLCLLSGCSYEGKYQLEQAYNNIQTVEVLYVSPYEICSNEQLLEKDNNASVDEGNWEKLITELENIPCKAYAHDPSWGITGDILRITYKDGSVELVGERGGLYYSADEWEYRYLYFEEAEFHALISVARG